MPGETASNHHVVTLGHTIKKIAELRQKMLEVAIHREHITTGRRSQTVGDRPSNAIRRRAMERLDSCILRRERRHDLARAVRTAVVHRDDLVDIFPIEIQDSLDQRTNVHLLVVTRNHHGDGAAKRFVSEQRNPARAPSCAEASARAARSNPPSCARLAHSRAGWKGCGETRSEDG